jgi:uncharacterized membrane protein
MSEWDSPQLQGEEGPGAALFGYILLLASLIFMVTGVIAVVIAYIYRDEAPAWLQSHYQLQIRTFWISLLVVAIGTLLLKVMIGFLIMLVWLVWFLARCIKGVRYINRRRPYPNPESWWI